MRTSTALCALAALVATGSNAWDYGETYTIWEDKNNDYFGAYCGWDLKLRARTTWGASSSAAARTQTYTEAMRVDSFLDGWLKVKFFDFYYFEIMPQLLFFDWYPLTATETKTSCWSTFIALVRRLDLIDQYYSFTLGGSLTTLQYRTQIKHGVRYCEQNLLYVLDYYVINDQDWAEVAPDCSNWQDVIKYWDYNWNSYFAKEDEWYRDDSFFYSGYTSSFVIYDNPNDEGIFGLF